MATTAHCPRCANASAGCRAHPLPGLLLTAVVLALTHASAAASGLQPLYVRSVASRLPIATLPSRYDVVTVTDVELADLDGDRRLDIVVAWFATDFQNTATNRRFLTIFANVGNDFVRAADLDLFVYDPQRPAWSIFYNGTSEVAVGNFDGDGDFDLAVTAFFGDELWLIENLGRFQFVPRPAFPFGSNGSGNSITPPRALAADFDGDGRDDLVYLADPLLLVDGEFLHFWKTNGPMSAMFRVGWGSFAESLIEKWTRALTIGDFDGDRRPDLAFTGARSGGQERQPMLALWYGFAPTTGRFRAREWPLPTVCSDILVLPGPSAATPELVLTDLHGLQMHIWSPVTLSLDYALTAELNGYAGLAFNCGMAVAAADMNGDGRMDLVTKQKLGGPLDANQIEITLGTAAPPGWVRVAPSPIDTTGWSSLSNNAILRPRNLALGDLLGNTLPEIVAGFAGTRIEDKADDRSGWTLELAIWENGCRGDVNRDGVTSTADLVAVLAALGTVDALHSFNPDLDVTKDGRVLTDDLRIVRADIGCQCNGCAGLAPADTDCDGRVDLNDIEGLLVALLGRAEYAARYPNCDWLNADCNGDNTVNFDDIEPFVTLLVALAGA